MNTGLGVVSDNFVWKNIGSFPNSEEKFCDVYGPHLDSAELSVTSAFYITLVQLIVDKISRYAHQEDFEKCRAFHISL